MRRARSVWRARALLFILLGLLVVVNVAFLASYRLFYDARLEGLRETTRDLEGKRDAARDAAEKVRASGERLASLQNGLEEFYRESLGTRKERLASVIEDVYTITGKAGMRPDDIAFAESEIPGAERFQLTFAVSGRYPEIKKLLAAFESNPQFLILETVGLASDGTGGPGGSGSGGSAAAAFSTDPDALRVGLVVAHYFRGETASVPKRVRAPRPATSRRSAAEPSKPAPSGGGKDLE